MATACFWGFPAFISVLMLAETVLAELPRFKGTYKCISGDTKKLRRKDLRRAADGVSWVHGFREHTPFQPPRLQA